MAVGGISADISDLEDARRELERRERLLRNLIEVQEEEKQLLCHEFHDGLIQYAVGSKMLLEALRETALPESCRAVVDSVIDCLAKGIEDGRRSIRGIRPAALDDLGLRAALDDLADELRASGIGVETILDPSIDLLPASLQTTLYRIAQESFNNVRKHSGSPRVRLTVAQAAGRVELIAEDDGHGFDQAVAGGEGFGLLGVRERVRLVGGECAVESAPGRGTRLKVSLPVPADEAVGSA
jgi:two-component system NarL family sensor kinase